MSKIERIKWLVALLNKASEAYYNTDTELMSNYDWDKKYDELKQLEEETGFILSSSPTQNAGYEVAEGLPKSVHEVPVQSLDKTKSIEELAEFVGEQESVLSWKLDGLTIVLTYENGRLVKAVTRGKDGIGELVTENAKAFANIPLAIDEKGKLIVRGESLITYEDFERINKALPEGRKKYENPRNLCSGSVRQLDPKETKRRNVQFKAFSLAAGGPSFTRRSEQLDYLTQLGFDAVEYVIVKYKNVKEPEELAAIRLKEIIEGFAAKISENAFPSDGLVVQYNDISYGESLGRTDKFPRDSIAFKWEDETKETTVKEIEWNASRTGLINPIAVFEPIRLEGTTVSRATLHNVSIVKELSITPGDTISVYKANMIIPKVAENLTKNNEPQIPGICPVCGQKTEIRKVASDAETLWCPNRECPAKHIGRFNHAVKRDALNIEGLSEETLQKFMDAGLLKNLPDLFHLKEKKEEIMSMEGFGEKSFEKLAENIEKARHTNLQKLIYALGITNVGRTATKAICAYFDYDVIKTINAGVEELLKIPDIGEGIASSFVSWFKNQCNQELFEDLLAEVVLKKPEKKETDVSLAGKTFVITGSVNHYGNRNELKAEIEAMGGKVSGSVSSKTDYLINNDITSTSGKNKKAKELAVPIITEDEYRKMAGLA